MLKKIKSMTSAEMEACQLLNGANGSNASLNNEVTSAESSRHPGARAKTSTVTWKLNITEQNRSPDFHEMHKNMTLLLKNLGENSKSILLMPFPYDEYARKIVNVLKTIFTAEGDIPAYCCFDSDIYTEYEQDKNSWTERTLADSKIIVIFVCLTSPGENTDCIVYNLLNSCRKECAFPKCHMLFLHVTDKDKDLQNRYHGDDIHIKHENAFESVLRSILKACGKDPNANSHILEGMLNCEAYIHFLELIRDPVQKS